MLAYVFWHTPAATADRSDYEQRLAAFHRALADDPPPGFHGSSALRTGEREYEDWYLVEDWAALGVLNRHAVSGSRQPPHDAAARLAADGTAGIYALLAGPAEPPAQAHGAWLGKPPDLSYEAFHQALPQGVTAWQRQMTLGPRGEYTLRADAPLDLPWPHTPVAATRVG
jgi:hypothetical protein